MKAGVAELSDSKNKPGSKAWCKWIRAHAKELALSIDTNYKDLAKDLFAIYDTPIDGDRANPPVFTSWGFKTFRDYAEQELNLHYKKAESIRGIWYWREIELESIDPAIGKRLDALEWTKLRVLKRIVTLSNAKHWVERAENMNYQTLEAAVKKAIDRAEDAAIEAAVRKKGDPIEKSNKLAADKTEDELEEEEAEESAPPAQKEYDWDHPDYFTSKSFAFLPDQLETVKQALKRASELSNSPSGGVNLALICLDYLATNDFMKASEEQRLRYVAKLEKLLSYKLIVVDPKTKDVLYGLGTLEKVATAQG
jgi:hypothetical protein